MADTASEKIYVSLTGVQETLLATLHARVWDLNNPTPVLGDRFAGETFARIANADAVRARYPPKPLANGTVAARSRSYDDWVVDFLAEQAGKKVTVLHLACGLDARALRLRDRGCLDPVARWVDLDMPEVVALREKLMPQSQSRPDLGPGVEYELIGASVTQRGWMDRIAAESNRTPGAVTLVVIEGLLPYLQPEESHAVLHDLVDRFSRNGGTGCIMFDAMTGVSRYMLQIYSRLFGYVGFQGLSFPWTIESTSEIENLHEKLVLREALNLAKAKGVASLPLSGRLPLFLISCIPYLGTPLLLLRTAF